MPTKLHSDLYRKDIDGLRSIAILAVVFYHFGYLSNGYLGVDVFFVISGFLITKIIYTESNENRFSILNFYLRRIRRIIPLVFFTSIVTLIIGMLVMLPDDLENLSQSIIATFLFSNNILLYITIGDYWNIINDFKPLMHTWSLGIEEQFYIIYPIIFLLFKAKNTKYIIIPLVVLSIVSLSFFVFGDNNAAKFYLLPARFFELSAGGIAAIYYSKFKIPAQLQSVILLVLILALYIGNYFSNQILLPLTVLMTVLLLLKSSGNSLLNKILLENKLMVFIGKISFSLYMWHQIVLAFTRYFVLEKVAFVDYILIFICTLLLSIFSYYFIESPFRNKKLVNQRNLLFTLGVVFVIVFGLSFYIYIKAGVIRDVPELNITTSMAERNLNTKYNSRVYAFDQEFDTSSKIKVLVVGDSFARDWANVLLESSYQNLINLSYIEHVFDYKSSHKRIENADVIFFSATIIKPQKFDLLTQKHKIIRSKSWFVGTKNFGVNNGIFYKNRYKNNYLSQRANIIETYIPDNCSMKKMWGSNYIDIINKVIDKDKQMPVFTPDGKFISQDGRHFTQAGAKYFGQLFNNELGLILKKIN